MTGKCEFCQNKLSGKEFIICSTCDKSMDNLRVWKGRSTSFNSEQYQKSSKTPAQQSKKQMSKKGQTKLV